EMIKPVARIVITFTSLTLMAAGILAGTQQPGPNLQQTPFGVREIPPAPGSPPTAPAQPQTEPATPQAEPATPQAPAATPAAAQPAPVAPQAPPQPAEPQRPDDIVPISLHLDNADIYQVIHIIADNLALNY